MDTPRRWQAQTAELRLSGSSPVLELEPAEWSPEDEVCLEQVKVTSHGDSYHYISGVRLRATFFKTPVVNEATLSFLSNDAITVSHPGVLARLFGAVPHRFAVGLCELSEKLPVVIEIHGPLTILAPFNEGDSDSERTTSGARLRLVK